MPDSKLRALLGLSHVICNNPMRSHDLGFTRRTSKGQSWDLTPPTSLTTESACPELPLLTGVLMLDASLMWSPTRLSVRIPRPPLCAVASLPIFVHSDVLPTRNSLFFFFSFFNQWGLYFNSFVQVSCETPSRGCCLQKRYRERREEEFGQMWIFIFFQIINYGSL